MTHVFVRLLIFSWHGEKDAYFVTWLCRLRCSVCWRHMTNHKLRDTTCVFVPRLISSWHASFICNTFCVTWLIRVCHDSLIRATTHSYATHFAWRFSFAYNARTHFAWHDSFLCAMTHLSGSFSKKPNTYGVATLSRIDKMIGLFCKRALYKRRYSAKETCHFIDPTDRSHPIFNAWDVE